MAPLFHAHLLMPDGAPIQTWLPFIPEVGHVLTNAGKRYTVTGCEYSLELHFFRVTLVGEVSDARAQNSDAGRRGRRSGPEVPAVQTRLQLGQLDPQKKH